MGADEAGLDVSFLMAASPSQGNFTGHKGAWPGKPRGGQESLQSAGEPPVGLLCPWARGWDGIFGTRKELLSSLGEAGTACHLSENSRRLKSPVG